jgi:hypothetical protein
MKPFVGALSFMLLASCARTAEPVLQRNPALVYWQASARLPVIGDKDIKLVADILADRKSTDDPAAARLLANCEAPLHLFRRASDSKVRCDWGLMLEDGPLTVLPHTSKMQMLNRLALCEAKRLFAANDNVHALEWIIAVRKAARHIAVDDLLVCTLTQFAMESQAIALTAAHVNALTEIQRKTHLHEIGQLPPLRTVAQSMTGEMVYLDWAEREFTHLDGAHQPKPKPQEAVAGEESPVVVGDADMKMLYEQLMNGSAHEMIEEARGYLRLAAAACEMPWKKGKEELARVEALINEKGNALARMMSPQLGTSRERELRLATESTMLRAALERGDNLVPGPLEGYTDALVGMPLVVNSAPQGVVITTSPGEGLRPLNLRIGR